MAQRRMFSLKVVDTDAFCEMPSSAQNLYFHIGMRADDEGFFAGVKGLMAKIHASNDDLQVLLARRFVLDRKDGVYVVKHWKMNNYLQKDRIQPTEYSEKKIGLYEKNDGSYTLDEKKAVKHDDLYTFCIHSVVESSVVESSAEKNTEELTRGGSLTPNQKAKCEEIKKKIAERKAKGTMTEEETKTEFGDIEKKIAIAKTKWVNPNG